MPPRGSVLLFSILNLILFVNIIHCSTEDNEVSADITIVNGDCVLSQSLKDEVASYADVTNQIIEYFTNGPYKGKTWESLAKFVDKFGSRFTGSETLEKSIDHMVQLLKDNLLENVHTEAVEVPRWTRLQESAELLLPRSKKIPILGIGSSVPTPGGSINAEVVVVTSFQELDNLPDDEVKGKIVVYAQPYVNYGTSVQYRTQGASKASAKGAVAALVRSITPFSLNTPHTGMQEYDGNVIPIPVACITVEDALELLRYQRRNVTMRISLSMLSTQETGLSRNTVAELVGREKAEKVVLVSGHLDSWDVGEGAIDDGGGVFISWTAPAVMKKLNLRPRRTVRAILWTAEEVGIIGSVEYEKRHRDENKNLNFVMESDIGTFEPLGLSYTGNKEGECLMREIGKLFTSINATQVVNEDSGPDLGSFIKQGVPAGGLKNKNERYFWYHHTDADRVSNIDPDALDKCAAYWTAFSYIVADLSIDVPRDVV